MGRVLAQDDVSTIGKPHEYFDLTVNRLTAHQPLGVVFRIDLPVGKDAVAIDGVELDRFYYTRSQTVLQPIPVLTPYLLRFGGRLLHGVILLLAFHGGFRFA